MLKAHVQNQQVVNVQTTVGCNQMKKIVKVFIFLSTGFIVSQTAHAAKESLKTHQTKMDLSVKTCPKDPMVIAEEILKLELAGMRWRRSKVSCFESLGMKYVHGVKTPDGSAESLIKVQEGSLQIISVKENKKFYSYDISFTVKNEKGETIKESISFMTNADFGGKKPEYGCALISATPIEAFVAEKCL